MNDIFKIKITNITHTLCGQTICIILYRKVFEIFLSKRFLNDAQFDNSLNLKEVKYKSLLLRHFKKNVFIL